MTSVHRIITACRHSVVHSVRCVRHRDKSATPSPASVYVHRIRRVNCANNVPRTHGIMTHSKGTRQVVNRGVITGYCSCQTCDCNVAGSALTACDRFTGQCKCKDGYTGRDCSKCMHGHYEFPTCRKCKCNTAGTRADACQDADNCSCDETGQCPCKVGGHYLCAIHKCPTEISH